MTIRRALTALALSLVVVRPSAAIADWHIRPFLGVAFGGDTTLLDLEQAAGESHLVFGISGMLLGEIFGLEADVGRAPRFFLTGRHLVTQGSVTTLTGSLVVALPRTLTEYTLRPYLVGGAGFARVRIEDFLDVLHVATTLPVLNVGGGVTGYVTDRIGVSWDVRRFQSLDREVEGRGVSFGREELSFWRANMALAIRY